MGPERHGGGGGALLLPVLLLLGGGAAAAAARLLASASPHWKTRPRIFASSAQLGAKRFPLNASEGQVVLYQKGNSSVLVGTVNKLYILDFEHSTNYTEPFEANETLSKCKNSEHARNYLTLIEKYDNKTLICGTNACDPTCWFWVDGQKKPGIVAKGLAPFTPDQNALVLIDEREIYSTIKKNMFNGMIPRFRTIRGQPELHTSDTVMKNPQFVKATVIKQDEENNDKIYLFFREDNTDWLKNGEAPMNVSRVARLCKGDQGGSGSHSSTKWTTFLKATLLCVDPATDRHFSWLQDVFIVRSANWVESQVYGLFTNAWGYSAVCVFSVGDIDHNFQTSPLKGYEGSFPPVRPGQCLNTVTPRETFIVADNHPEVERKVQQKSILFYTKARYQKIRVHQVEAADGATYSVLYLATDKGAIHKIVSFKSGVMNILEIQPFQDFAPIHSMVLDPSTNKLFVASAKEVVQLPLATCEAYKNDCESCVLARDPYCGWIHGKCTSVHASRQPKDGPLLQELKWDVSSDVCPVHPSNMQGNAATPCKRTVVGLSSRYYLNCSVESHHATYTWLRDKQSIMHCSAGSHHPCIHFIDTMTTELYGTYTCVAREDWFNQTVVTECLEQPPLAEKVRNMQPLPPVAGWATTVSLPFWLGLLQMAVVVLFLQ